MTNQTKNNNLIYLIDPTFTKVNRLFVLSFQNENDGASFSKYDVANVIIQTHIFLTRDITATGGDANSRLAFKNCTQFTKCITDINDEHVDNADNLDIIMPIYNSIEHSDNYSDTSGSL